MQLIGATHNYVRKPYLIAGLLHGILGGLISIVLVLVTLYFAQQQIPELVVLQNYTEFIALCLGILGIGIFISISSTYFAVTRYLKLKAYDLY